MPAVHLISRSTRRELLAGAGPTRAAPRLPESPPFPAPVAQPDKSAVINDRENGYIFTLTCRECEARAIRVANVLLSLASGGGPKVI